MGLLTDLRDPNLVSPPSALIRAYTLRPRTIGITASYRL
jgi:hypothetical protein